MKLLLACSWFLSFVTENACLDYRQSKFLIRLLHSRTINADGPPVIFECGPEDFCGGLGDR